MKNAKITIGLIGLLLIGLVSVRKEGKVQEAGLLLQNVEALATGESFPDGEIACFGDGSVDCPFTYLKVEVDGWEDWTLSLAWLRPRQTGRAMT